MNPTLIPPPPLPAVVQQPARRSWKQRMIPIGAGVLGVAAVLAISAAGDDEPARRPANADSVALDIVWPAKRAQICSGWQTMADVDEQVADRLAITSFEEGWDKPMTPALRQHLLELLHDC